MRLRSLLLVLLLMPVLLSVASTEAADQMPSSAKLTGSDERGADFYRDVFPDRVNFNAGVRPRPLGGYRFSY